MSKWLGAACLFVALTATFPKSASPTSAIPFASYVCTVKNVYALKKEGTLEENATHLLVSEGSTFVVERKTGRMLGDLSSTGWIGRNEVLDLGSGSQSYKALYVSPPHVHVRLLLIKEYEEGDEKPFLFVEDTDIYTGLCRHTN
jgi:hypothetical protein